jgi:hypothetical protein
MKNINGETLVKCILIMSDDFDRLIKQLYPDEETSTEYSMDGISVYVNDEQPTDLFKRLAEHYGVKEVQSIHIDDAEYVGVWLAYID